MKITKIYILHIPQHYFLLFFLSFLTFKASLGQDYRLYAGPEFLINFKRVQAGDTINRRDEYNMKQGLWVFNDNASGNVLTAGYYKNDKKEDFWVKFDSNGFKISEFQYKNGQPNGVARVFYTNGKIQEEGVWKGTTWVGKYKFYFENGNLCYEWNYNEDGLRVGEQKYFHENGKIKIEGSWAEGKKNGFLKEYYEDGNIKSQKVFLGDKMDETKVVEYPPVNVVAAANKNKNETDSVNNNGSPENNLTFGVFNPNGYNKLYNIQFNKIEKDGYFRNGQLYTGKQYIYNEEGELIRAVEYKDGKIIQDEKFLLDSINLQ